MDTVEPLEQESVTEIPDQTVTSVEAHDPYAALHFRDFGHAADRFSRKQIILITQMVAAVASLGLALLSRNQGSLALIYGCLFVIGVGRAFSSPASSAFLSQTVPASMFVSAATWSSSAWQLAAVIGPAFGGLMIALFHSAASVFLVDAIACFVFVAMIVPIQAKQAARAREATTVKSLAAGIHYVWNDKVILAAITLDMFAVLLGGATALLPVYARDILNVGPTGLGWLTAAPSIGAVLMALIIAHRPPFKHAGRTLLWAVAGFGAATIVFGVSQSFILSLLMLGALGALDNISVVIRSTLMLTRTPDEMRGRISAVNGVFVGASNELGRFESGVAANFFGPVIAVVAGGVGAIAVVTLVAGLWPEMRKLGGLNE